MDDKQFNFLGTAIIQCTTKVDIALDKLHIIREEQKIQMSVLGNILMTVERIEKLLKKRYLKH